MVCGFYESEELAGAEHARAYLLSIDPGDKMSTRPLETQKRRSVGAPWKKMKEPRP